LAALTLENEAHGRLAIMHIGLKMTKVRFYLKEKGSIENNYLMM